MSNILNTDETADSMRAVIELEDEFHEALSRLPRADHLAEYIAAMHAVIRLEDDFHTALSRLPSIEELNERIEAVQTATKLIV